MATTEFAIRGSFVIKKNNVNECFKCHKKTGEDLFIYVEGWLPTSLSLKILCRKCYEKIQKLI